MLLAIMCPVCKAEATWTPTGVNTGTTSMDRTFYWRCSVLRALGENKSPLEKDFVCPNMQMEIATKVKLFREENH
jgi:hypothetical protein